MSDLAEDVRRLYQDVVLRHSRAPLHAHRPAAVTASAVGDNPMCGDHVEVFIHQDADGVINEVGFEARGCAISIASADLMAALLAGVPPTQALHIGTAFTHMIETGQGDDPALATLRPLSGVHDYPSRRRCATLPWQAMAAALRPPSADTAQSANTGQAAVPEGDA